MPAELVERMRAADEFGKGIYVAQQMFYAALASSSTARDPKGLDTTALVRRAAERSYVPFPYVEGTHFQRSLRAPGRLLGASTTRTCGRS